MRAINPLCNAAYLSRSTGFTCQMGEHMSFSFSHKGTILHVSQGCEHIAFKSNRWCLLCLREGCLDCAAELRSRHSSVISQLGSRRWTSSRRLVMERKLVPENLGTICFNVSSLHVCLKNKDNPKSSNMSIFPPFSHDGVGAEIQRQLPVDFLLALFPPEAVICEFSNSCTFSEARSSALTRSGRYLSTL